MPSYTTLTTARLTVPDPVALLAAVKTATTDPTAVLSPVGDGSWRGKKASPWSAADLTATQLALDATAALTPQLAAQHTIDDFPIAYRALVLALIDQLNVIRAALPVPLGPISPTQAIAAIRTKAGTL